MKLRFARSGNRAMSLFEVFIVVAIFIFLATLFLMCQPHAVTAQRISCVNNLKQVGLAFRVWEGDNNDKFPMMVSVTNGGTMELIGTDPEFLRDTFLVMSNELSTPKVPHCPEDVHGEMSSEWSALTRSNISYFIGVDATDAQPQMILSGDDNFTADGSLVHSGLTSLSTNAAVAWTRDRHIKLGNIGLADGSAQELTTSDLHRTLVQTGFQTNRFAIP